MDIIYNNGEIYLGIDVELCASLDELLHNKFYIGFESPEYVNSRMGFGTEKYNKTVKKLLDEYSYFNGDEVLGCPILNTRALLAIGMETGGNKQVFQELV